MKLLAGYLLLACLAFPMACADSAPPARTVATLPNTTTNASIRLDEANDAVYFGHDESSEKELTPGVRTDKIRFIRTGPSPAKATIFRGETAIGKLWLDEQSRLRFAADEEGGLLVDITSGQARLKLFRDQSARLLKDGTYLKLESDHLFAAARAGMQHTVNAPESVRWTHSVGQHEEEPDVGSLNVQSPGGGDEPLVLTELQVRGSLVGKQVLVEVEHHFRSDVPGSSEGTFRFPLPDQAALVGLAMDVEGKMMEGELVEKHKARQTYETIVDSMRDPALLEWEPGNVFKLRVFPLLEGKTKRVLVRYLAPLKTDGADSALHLVLGAPALQDEPPLMSASLDGKVIAIRSRGPQARVTFSGKGAASITQNEIENRTYTHVTYRAPVPEEPRGVPATGRDVLLLLDTSRSALETSSLAQDAIDGLLASLTPDDRIKVARSDLFVEALTPLWSSSEVAGRIVSESLAQMRYDGASDLGAAFHFAAHEKKARGGKRGQFEVVYIGDATATWGETRPDELAKLAKSIGSPVHSLSLDKGASQGLLSLISAQTGGRAASPDTAQEVHTFGAELESRAGSSLLTEVQVLADPGHEVYPKTIHSLAPGDSLDIIIRSKAFARAPSHVFIKGKRDGKLYTERLELDGAVNAPLVHKRFFERHLSHLTLNGAKPEQIVRDSLKHGIMSRHTAFLVLESEEAYERFNIERKKRNEFKAPAITGGDLDSLDARRSSLSPNRLQPGDPEVLVPAPKSAHSVRVYFPFGDIKEAHYEEGLKAWTVRFLVSEGTPDGIYPVRVRIQHEDQRIEFLSLSYVVDTVSPTLQFSLKRSDEHLTVVATQSSTKEEMALCREQGSAENDKELFHRFGTDSKRAELRLSDGQVFPMTAIRLGTFVQTLPVAAWGNAFSILVWDKAGNLRETQLAIDDSGALVPLASQTTKTGVTL